MVTFVQLKHSFTSRTVAQQELEEVKLDFKEVIHSRRTYSCIKTMEQLLAVLENRMELTCTEVGALRTIAWLLLDSNLLEEVKKYNEQVTAYTAAVSSQARQTQRNYHNNLLKIPVEVLTYVSEEIGREWRNLGRQLGVSNGDIDEIDVVHHWRLKEKAYQILWKFQATTNERRPTDALMRALKKCYRVDMANKVGDVLRSQI